MVINMTTLNYSKVDISNMAADGMRVTLLTAASKSQ
jgi:hypothetical protein